MTLFSEDLLYALSRCIGCGNCNTFCQVFFLVDQREKLSPRAWIRTSSMVGLGQVKVSVEYIESLYACTQCSLCRNSCPVGLDPFALIMSSRKELIDQGYVPPIEVAALPEEVVEGSPLLPGPHWERNKWLPRDMPRSGRYLFISGAWARSAPDSAVASIELARRRLDLFVADREPECGLILRLAGYLDQYRELTGEMLALIEDLSPVGVVSGCPARAESLRELGVNALHPVDLLVEESPSARRKKPKVALIPDPLARSTSKAAEELLQSVLGPEFLGSLPRFSASCGHLITFRSNPDIVRSLFLTALKEAEYMGASEAVFLNPLAFALAREILRGERVRVKISELSQTLLKVLS